MLVEYIKQTGNIIFFPMKVCLVPKRKKCVRVKKLTKTEENSYMLSWKIDMGGILSEFSI